MDSSDKIPLIPNEPMIAITGRREITIDGFGGIEEYSDTEISFKAGGMLVTVSGHDLVIRYMSIKTLVVAGGIDDVRFSGKKE